MVPNQATLQCTSEYRAVQNILISKILKVHFHFIRIRLAPNEMNLMSNKFQPNEPISKENASNYVIHAHFCIMETKPLSLNLLDSLTNQIRPPLYNLLRRYYHHHGQATSFLKNIVSQIEMRKLQLGKVNRLLLVPANRPGLQYTEASRIIHNSPRT
jgi:hypothetical protein